VNFAHPARIITLHPFMGFHRAILSRSVTQPRTVPAVAGLTSWSRRTNLMFAPCLGGSC
jgi:hypothetical protein